MNLTELYGPIEEAGDFDFETVIIILTVLGIIFIVFVREIKPYSPGFVLSH